MGEDLVEWLATPEELLRAIPGEWVAFAGRHVVAHAPSFLQVMRQVEALGSEDLLLVPVAPDQPLIV